MFESRKLAPLLPLVPIEAPTFRSALALRGQSPEFRTKALRLSRTDEGLEIVTDELIEAGPACLR